MAFRKCEFEAYPLAYEEIRLWEPTLERDLEISGNTEFEFEISWTEKFDFPCCAPPPLEIFLRFSEPRNLILSFRALGVSSFRRAHPPPGDFLNRCIGV